MQLFAGAAAAKDAGDADIIKDGSIQTFARDVLDASMRVPVLVDFWAPWCPPCRAIAPVLEALADEYAGQVKFAKVNVDENPRTATAFSVASIPTLILFKGGRPVDILVGAHPRAGIEGVLKKHLAA